MGFEKPIEFIPSFEAEKATELSLGNSPRLVFFERETLLERDAINPRRPRAGGRDRPGFPESRSWSTLIIAGLPGASSADRTALVVAETCKSDA